MQVSFVENPTDAIGNMLSGRFKQTVTDTGNVILEAWNDYLVNLAASPAAAGAVNSTITVTATFTKYDGTPCDATLPGPSQIVFNQGGQTVTVQVVNGQAQTTVTSSTAGTFNVLAYAQNVKLSEIEVTFA